MDDGSKEIHIPYMISSSLVSGPISKGYRIGWVKDLDPVPTDKINKSEVIDSAFA